MAPDAPLGNGWLIEQLGGEITVLAIGTELPDIPGAKTLSFAPGPHMRRRYLGDMGGAIYLIRPDQVVAGRWVSAEIDTVRAAVDAVWAGA